MKYVKPKNNRKRLKFKVKYKHIKQRNTYKKM